MQEDRAESLWGQHTLALDAQCQDSLRIGSKQKHRDGAVGAGTQL
jgi:hypothetical protein